MPALMNSLNSCFTFDITVNVLSSCLDFIKDAKKIFSNSDITGNGEGKSELQL